MAAGSPEQAELLLREAMQHFRLGELEACLEKLQRILEISPQHPQACNYITVVQSRLDPSAARRRAAAPAGDQAVLGDARELLATQPETRIPDAVRLVIPPPAPAVAPPAESRPRPRSAPEPETGRGHPAAAPEPETGRARAAAQPQERGGYLAQNWKWLLALVGSVAVLAAVAAVGGPSIRSWTVEMKVQQARDKFLAGNPREALPLLEWAVQERPQDVGLIELLGDAYLGLAQPEPAMKVYQSIIDGGGANSGLFAKLGRAAAARGDTVKAVQAFREADQRGASSTQDLVQLAEAYDSLNMVDEAIETYRRLAADQPGNIEYRLIMGRLHQRRGQHLRAITEFEGVLGIDEFNIPAHIGLGESLERSGRRKQAIEVYRKPLQWSPDNRELIGRIGHLYLAQGDHAKAKKEFERLLVLSSRDPGGRAGMAALALAQGKLGDARRELDRALSTNAGQTVPNFLLLAEIQLRSKQPSEALAACTKALELDSASADAWEKRGQVLAAMRDAGQARQALERAMELDPGRESARRLLKTLSK